MKLFLLSTLLAGVLAQKEINYNTTQNDDPLVLDYATALQYSLRFYEAQRSGVLPADNRIPWRGDSFVLDKAPDNSDLGGGYFDGSDFRKITQPLAFTLSQIAWGVLRYKDAYKSAEQYDYALDMLRWGLDWLLRAHYRDDELVIQVGNTALELGSWGRPEDSMLPRPVFSITSSRPGPDVAGAAAAAMAAGAMVLESTDRDFAIKLRNSSMVLYENLVKDQTGHAFDTLPKGEKAFGQYNSSSSFDDALWAALWLNRATERDEYVKDAKKLLRKAIEEGPVTVAWSWDNSLWGAFVLMQEMGLGDPTIEAYLDDFFGAWLQVEGIRGIRNNTEGYAFFNPILRNGTVWNVANRTNGIAANAAYLAFLAAPYMGQQTADDYRCFAQHQINWLLGENRNRFSSMVGFGVADWPDRPNSRTASCPEPATAGLRSNCTWVDAAADKPNPHELFGALVSGIGQQSVDWVNDRGNMTTNSISLDLNGGITGALAALLSSDSVCSKAKAVNTGE